MTLAPSLPACCESRPVALGYSLARCSATSIVPALAVTNRNWMSTAVSRDTRPLQRVPSRQQRRKPHWLHETRRRLALAEIGVRRERVILPFLVLLFLAFTVRGVAATRLIPHVDEAATML